MNSQKIENPYMRFSQKPARPGMFKDFDATELYCPKCRRAVPVNKRLLLILPEGDKYEYRCAFCAEPVGIKMDRDESRSPLILS